MMFLVSWLLIAITILLAVPSSAFAIEVLASAFTRRWIEPRERERRPRVAVLVPAHNEAAGIVATLHDIKNQLRPSDRLLVVADNCSDDTAELAASAGAEVSVRSDLTRLGKGYALDWGVRYLERDAPEILVIIDADCRLAPLTIDRLAISCQQAGRPIQSLYLMTAPPGPSINHQVAEFAWRVKNLVRPLGLLAMGFPCQLMGTGMAFPWPVIRAADLGGGHIVEDMKLGLDLARVGYAPLFCPSACVTSTFPSSAEGAKKQRQRWEHGQIGLILTDAFPLLIDGIVRRNPALIVLVLDMIVPPLSLLLICQTAATLAVMLFAISGGRPVALVIGIGCLALIGFATVFAWTLHGRGVLPAKSLALIPTYLLTKLRHYVSALLGGRTSRWVRTDRS